MNYGPINPKMPHMIHGADYNPDQWLHDKGIVDEDFRMMDIAYCNTMSIGIFSWMNIEPEEDHYTFEWMDDMMDRLARSGKYAVLATPSGARPIWISKSYPEVLRVDANRRKQLHGERHNHCYTSPQYRRLSRKMNEALALRYKDHPALLVWHISNEFGGECHCELCQEAFRDWLRDKYNHNIDRLNREWWTSFWSHTYRSFDDIESPSPIGEQSVHGLNLDWKRFVTHQMTDYMLNEMEPLKRITPNVPITTNFMATYPGLDYWKMAKHLDVVSWDNYPAWHSPIGDEAIGSSIAMIHDMTRSFKQGRPFMLMESTPSVTNWLPVSKLKRPGMHRLSSLQAIAHGADTVQYFQWRKSRGSVEKFHGAVVDHVGHEHTRVFRDVSEVGKALTTMDDIIGTSVQPEVAVIYDWDNRWAIDDVRGFNNDKKDYLKTVMAHYKPLWELGISTDIIDMEESFTGYKMIIAPMLYLLKPGVATRLEAFVEKGGTLVCTYMTGLVNENDLCFTGGFPGPLRKLLGIWCEETDALHNDDRNSIQITMDGMMGQTYGAYEWCDLIHAETADVLGTYKQDFYAGYPALTRNRYGEGEAYYIAFRNHEDFERDFYTRLLETCDIHNPLHMELPEGISLTTRYDEKHQFYFLMNFKANPVALNIPKSLRNIETDKVVHGQVEMSGYEVWVLEDDNTDRDKKDNL